MVQAWLSAAHPEAGIRVVNKGIGGHTVRDLAARWQTDVLDQQPDVLCIMIGINDVWRQFDSPLRPELSVGLEEYAETLEKLLLLSKLAPASIYLATPFFIDPNRADAMRARMDEYGEIVRQTAAKHGTNFVDTQAAFEPVLAHFHSAALAWDRVHPSPAGHMVIARAFLKAFASI
jgi:lysophospholipase L1-like esterase